LPVVATAIGGTPEVVQEGNMVTLIQPGDTEALCNALKEMFSLPGMFRGLKSRTDVALQGVSFSNMIVHTERALSDVVRS
jgi:glycosyltransferase involved in cell wall biosynthesis